jgi:hypothetical protein
MSGAALTKLSKAAKMLAERTKAFSDNARDDWLPYLLQVDEVAKLHDVRDSEKWDLAISDMDVATRESVSSMVARELPQPQEVCWCCSKLVEHVCLHFFVCECGPVLASTP